MAADKFQRFVEGKTVPASGGQIYFLLLIGDHRAAADFQSNMGEELLREIHEISERGKSPVEFAHGEFRIMPGIRCPRYGRSD